MGKYLTREEAYNLLLKYNKTESLINHGLAVEGVMRHFATLLNEDEEKWGIVGLIHDLDYEMYPEEHCKKVIEILKEEDVNEETIHAVISHGFELCTDVEPVHIMEKVLYTIDELTGLITAAALMRPSKSVMDLEYKSVNKKFKQISFASGVNREVIKKGAVMLDMELKYVIEETIKGMRKVATEIGLGE